HPVRVAGGRHLQVRPHHARRSLLDRGRRLRPLRRDDGGRIRARGGLLPHEGRVRPARRALGRQPCEGDVRTIASPPVIGPALRQERIEAIDILRGVAILGILIVNMRRFSMPEGPPAHQEWPNALDATLARLILFFSQEKFKALFSFLFGLGLAVQMMRTEARGARFLPLYARRLFVLLLIGVAHFVLLWDGDILHDYALLGFILLLFRRRSLKTLLVWASIFLSIPVLFHGL